MHSSYPVAALVKYRLPHWTNLFKTILWNVYSSLMTVKMKDIARDLGVSLVTVSKALRDHPDISAKTRQRVKERVEELGYRPNLAARSLVTGRSLLIGFIVPDLIHPFFAEVAKGLSLILREQGYFLVISSSEEDPLLEMQEIEQMLSHRLDALVVASCQMEPGLLAATRFGSIPLVLLDRYFDTFPAHFVGSDDHASGKLAAEHLLSIQCKHIAHIRGPENSTGRRRFKGFLDTLTKNKVALPPEYLIAARSADVDGKTHGSAALGHLMQLPTPPDGIFCFNDVIASGVIAAAAEAGIRIPEDLAVIGCGNLHYDSDMKVPLSSIDQRSREIGERTARLVLELMTKKREEKQTPADPGTHAEIAPRRVVLQPRLAPRASTARLTSAKPVRKASAAKKK
jgi:LacI family transcriptional regulator